MAVDGANQDSEWGPSSYQPNRHSRPVGLAGADLGPWFRDNARDLPWRATRDPWAVLVSEVMLQQTQVVRVVPRWEAFLERFPTVADCASAPVADVIELWSGLGYNRRAVNLHRAAGVIAGECGGVVPSRVGELLRLPGIGAYTARAVAVFAYEQPEAVVDTNVARVLARTEGRSLSRLQAQRLADRAVADRDPWTWNQALLDVGARLCRTRPECRRCPVAPRCHWYRQGCPEPDPARSSAGVSQGQSRFEGSDRQGRGRLVSALRHGSLPEADLARVAGWPDDPGRARRVAAGLVADGLAVADDAGGLRLPRTRDDTG